MQGTIVGLSPLPNWIVGIRLFTIKQQYQNSRAWKTRKREGSYSQLYKLPSEILHKFQDQLLFWAVRAVRWRIIRSNSRLHAEDFGSLLHPAP